MDFRDFLNGRTGCYDDYGHGTHVAGILAGNGKLSRGRYRGIAPECRLLPVKVLDRRGNGSRQDDSPGHRIWRSLPESDITPGSSNISVGTLGEGKEDEELIQAVEDAWDAGLIVVAGRREYGSTQRKHHLSRQQPEDHHTVGASDDEQVEAFPRKGRILTGYSGRGPTCACICKTGTYGSGHRDRFLQFPATLSPARDTQQKAAPPTSTPADLWSCRSASLSSSGSSPIWM